MVFSQYPAFHSIMSLRLLALFMALSLSACGTSDTQESNAQHLERAQAYQEQGQYKAAIIEYKNALKKSEGAAEPVIRYADMLNKVGHHQGALDLLNQIKAEKNQAYYAELVETHLGLGKFQSAKDVADKYLDNSRESQLLKARVLTGLGESGKAASIYQSLLNENPTDGAAMVGKAGLLSIEGKLSQALEALKTINKEDDSYRRGQLLLAGIHINQEQLEKAETVLSDLLSVLPNTDVMEPEKAAALERLSYVLTRLGRSNEAYIYTKLLAEAFPGANEVNEKYGKAVEQFQKGELDSAEGLLSEILEKYPSHNKSNQLLGIIRYLKGDTQQASEILSDSVDPEVANPLVKHVYAAANLKLNDPKKVIEILGPDIERNESAPTLALYGIAAISDQQFSKGEKALKRALEIDPENVRVSLILANYYRNGPKADIAQEKSYLDRAYKSAPKDRTVLQGMVGYLLRNESVAKTESFVNAHLKNYPEDFASNMVAGYFQVMKKNLVKASELFGAALNYRSSEEEHRMALFAKGRAEIALKKYEAAERTFSDFVEEYPEQQLGYKGFYSTYLARGKEAEARQKLESLAKRNGRAAPYVVLIQAAVVNADFDAANRYLKSVQSLSKDQKLIDELSKGVAYAEGTHALKSADFSTARDRLASLLVSEPENVRLLSFMVDLEIKAGKLNEAEKVIGQIKNLDPSHPVIPILEGDVALAQDKTEIANGFYKDAWETNPSEIAAEKLHRTLSILNETAARNELLASWVQRFPDSVPANLFQAMQYQQRGQRTRAAELYENLLELDPNHVAAMNNLGWLYFEKQDNRALPLLKKAAELAPESPAVLDSYGWVLFKNGQIREGLAYLEKANQLAPGNNEIAEHLKEAKAAL